MLKWSHLSHNFPLVSSQTSKGISWPYYWGENGCFLFVFGPYGSISGLMTLRPLERSTLPPVATHPLALLMVFCMLQLAPTKCSFAVYDVVCLCLCTCWFDYTTAFVHASCECACQQVFFFYWVFNSNNSKYVLKSLKSKSFIMS